MLERFVRLTETLTDGFYAHVRCLDRIAEAEVYLKDGDWRICRVPYADRWMFQSPLDVDFLDSAHLEQLLKEHLLLQYVYCSTITGDEITVRIIEKCVGKIICENAVVQFRDFEKALVAAVQKCLDSDRRG